MDRNPYVTAPEADETPPPDVGEPLGTIRFTNGNEIRVRWMDGDGERDPYVSLWLWAEGYAKDGRLWPGRARGFRLHPREVAPLRRILERAEARAVAFLHAPHEAARVSARLRERGDDSPPPRAA